MKVLTPIIIVFLSSLSLSAQTQKMLFGSVFNQDGEPLVGATVLWDETDIGTVADLNGNFELPKRELPSFLNIQYVGYNAVFIEVLPSEDSVFIKIDGITELETVMVTEQRGDIFTSTLDPVNTETISSCELKKAACCNLSESFETSGSVDVMKQDAVTSATEIQMLGLRGIYSQLLVEKRPAYTGLGSPLALEYIPGTWVSGIQVSKGASTVQNGPQAITGQINIELMKPWQDKPLFINLFGSTLERGEVNVHWNKKWSEAWSTGFLLHGSSTKGKFDHNDDTFLDQPLKKTLDGLFRTYYVTDVFSTQFNVQVLSDERTGGQIVPENADPANFYRIRQENHRTDVFGKFGYIGFADPNTSIGFIYNASWHKTDNIFGKTNYNGDQKSLYANLLFATALPNDHHKLNLGASWQHDDYQEFLDETDFSRVESMPGVFAEYSFVPEAGKQAGEASFSDKIGIIAGLRLDHHNRFGWFVTPRLNLKYNFTDNSILRLSAGRGVRTAQILSENLAVLASNRQLVADQQELDIEDAWNVGMNFTQKFKFLGRSANVLVDLYRTEFVNQVVMDMESDHGKVLFYNLNGRSFANSLLALIGWSPFKGFDMKLAYKLNDVHVTYSPSGAGGGDLIRRPLTAPHRALATLNYETPNERWMFNTNIHYTGWQRFADASHISSQVTDKQYFEGNAPAYVLLNAQVTRRFKNWEVYVGGENLTNYRQEHAILDWQNPFGEHFDAMQVWGPLVGARGYAGVRLWLD